MDSLPIDLQNDHTFHLIRLPKETVERLKEAGPVVNSQPVGTLIINKEGGPIFQDSVSKKTFDLISNTNPKLKVDKHDLIEVRSEKKEATHLGKVMPNTLISVPRKEF